MSSRSDIKKKQRESLIQKLLVPVLLETFRDEPELKFFSVSKIELSKDGGLCNIFLMTSFAPEKIEEAMFKVARYTIATRKALARVMQSRYVPEVRFQYDHSLEKMNQLNDILLRVGQELRNEDSNSEA